MRILLITTGLLTGGAEIQVAALAGEYTRQGHKVAILNLLGKTEITVHPDVHIESLQLRSSNFKMLNAWPGLWQARRFIQQWQPDVVHSHMVKANLFARVLRLVCPIPLLICTAHSVHEGGPLLMKLYRITDDLCDITTHVSHEAAAQFVKNGAVPQHKIAYMPNGIDTEHFDFNRQPQAKTQKNFVWLHVGRLAPEKSQHILLNAFAQVTQTHANTHLMIAGTGPAQAVLQALVQKLKLQENVTFMGRRTDVPQLMQTADAFVLSSHIEGSPLVLAEALACGLPCVSTDVSGVRALLTTHDRIVPVGDAQALAHAMLDTQNDPTPTELRDVRRAHIVHKFSLSAVAADWIRLYQNHSIKRQ